jgi:hypothetical protein
MRPARALRGAARWMSGGGQLRQLACRLPGAPVVTPEMHYRAEAARPTDLMVSYDGGEYEPVTDAEMAAIREEGLDGLSTPDPYEPDDMRAWRGRQVGAVGLPDAYLGFTPGVEREAG